MGREIFRKITTLILTLAFSCGAVVLIAVPLYRDLKITGLKIEIEQENKGTREEFLSRIIEFRKTNKGVQKEDLEKINQILLSRNSYEDYFSRVIYLAQTNNIVVKDFSVSQSSVPARVKMKESQGMILREAPELRETTIGFSALGDFPDFTAFISDFEKMGPLADEESLKITATRNKKDKEESEEESEGEGEEESSEENQEQEEELVLGYEVNFKFYY